MYLKGGLTLLDVYKGSLEGRLRMRKPVKEMIARGKVSAKPYIFDWEASKFVGEFLRDNLDLVLTQYEFAHPKFERMYVEIEPRALFSHWKPEQYDSRGGDTRLGYLIEGRTVVILAVGADHQDPMPSVMTFRLATPQRPGSLEQLFGTGSIGNKEVAAELPSEATVAKVTKLAYVMGGARQRVEGSGMIHGLPKNTTTYDLVIPFTEKASSLDFMEWFDVGATYENVDPTMAIDAAFLGSGDPVMLTACLLLLNQQTQYINLDVQPAGRTMFKGKSRTWRESSTVKIDLNNKPKIIRQMRHAVRSAPIAHPVAGHWRNYDRPRMSCEHAWEPVSGELTHSGMTKRWHCMKCEQKRTWVDDFHTGDAGVGFRTHNFEVTH